jgi:diguanylate cyclase (GGDEF)-like protein/PAS domain S-box-containing protein
MANILQIRRLVWVLLFFVVTLAGAFSYFSGTRYLAAVRAVEESLAVQLGIDHTLSVYKDAETGQRGFVLTGDEQFLEPLNAARAGIPDQLAGLHRVLDGDPAQRKNLAEIERIASEKLAHIDETVTARRAGELTPALAIARAGQGKALMDSMRAVTRRMLDREEAELNHRRHGAETAKSAAAASVLLGSIVTVLLALFGLITVQRDVGELRRTAADLAAAKEHFRLLTENSNDLVRLLDLSGKAIYVSPSVERLLGYTPEEFLALPGRSLMHPDEIELALSILKAVSSGRISRDISTYRLRNKAGEYRVFEVRWSVMQDQSGETRIHTAGRDVTERKSAEERLAAQAEELRSLSLRDELTRLYNRRGFLEVAGHAHAQATRDSRAAAIVFVDLNGMKRINDERGHDAGDDALRDTAHILTEAFGPSDVAARLGGDEFVVFSVDFRESDLDALRGRLRALADREANRHGRPYRLSMSIGAAFTAPATPRSLAELLEGADEAMYQQKRARQAAGNVSIPPRGAES